MSISDIPWLQRQRSPLIQGRRFGFLVWLIASAGLLYLLILRQQTWSALGIVGANDGLTLLSPADTQVEEVLVALGDEVQVGQVLARFAQRQALAHVQALDQRLALLRAQEQELNLAEAPRRRWQQSVSRASYLHDLQTLEDRLSALRQEQAGQLAELAVVESELTRQEQLVEQGLLSQGELFPLRQQRDSLKQRLQLFPERIDDLAKGLAELRRIVLNQDEQADWALAEQRLQQLQLSVTISQAQEERAQLQALLDAAELLSPIAGRVVALNCRGGSNVTRGAPVLQLTPLRSQTVLAWGTSSGNAVQLGDTVLVSSLDGGPASVVGTVRQIVPAMVSVDARFTQQWPQLTRGRPVLIDLAEHPFLTGEAVSITPNRGLSLP